MSEEGGDAEVEPGVEGMGEEGDVAAVGGGFEVEVGVGGGEGGGDDGGRGGERRRGLGWVPRRAISRPLRAFGGRCGRGPGLPTVPQGLNYRP